jgi:hypothetical protein
MQKPSPLTSSRMPETEFAKHYEKLVMAFGDWAEDPAAKAQLYNDNLNHLSKHTVINVINHAVKTCDRFPAISQLLGFVSIFETVIDPALDEAKAERQRQYHIDQQSRRTLEKINNLSEQERASIYKTAECFVPQNIHEWLPMKTRNFLVDMKAILLYKERYMNSPQPFDCLSNVEKTTP